MQYMRVYLGCLCVLAGVMMTYLDNEFVNDLILFKVVRDLPSPAN